MGRGGALPGPACKTILSCMGRGGVARKHANARCFCRKIGLDIEMPGLRKMGGH